MTQNARQCSDDLANVWVDTGLHERMAAYFDALTVRLMDRAAHHAKGRQSQDEKVVITPADIVQSARDYVPTLVSELAEALKDKPHVKKRKLAS